MSQILRAKEAFMVPGPTDVAKGDLFDSDDPIVQGREHLFEPVDATVRASVPGAVVSPPAGVDAGDGAKVRRARAVESAGD